jgi:hypothetical protein
VHNITDGHYEELLARVGELEAALRDTTELLGEYVKDEDRFNAGNGEPFGSISTKTGMLARRAVADLRKSTLN